MVTIQAPDRLLDCPPTDTQDAQLNGSRRRFVIAATAGTAVVLVPYLYILWDLLTGTVDPFRSVSPSNFYDLQAQAIIHGHLSVPRGALGIEGFIHDGRTYTYFGLLPSLLRIPLLLVVPHTAGHLTAPSNSDGLVCDSDHHVDALMASPDHA